MDEDNTHRERRDALSQEWGQWLYNLLPQAVLFAIPNRPSLVDSWWKVVQPELLVLTGGNSWNQSSDRDETERRMVVIARENNVPILGICRGMQSLNVMFGGELVLDVHLETGENHVNHNHDVSLCSPIFVELVGSTHLIVNSFHDQGILLTGMAENFIPFALSPKEVVEGMYHETEEILAIQWHPERVSPSSEYDELIVQKFLEFRAFWKDTAE